MNPRLRFVLAGGSLLFVVVFTALGGARGQQEERSPSTPTITASPQTVTSESGVVVRAHAEPTEATIGDRIRYTIEVEAPAGVELTMPVLAERIGAFEIIDFGSLPPPTGGTRARVGAWYTLTTFETGRYVLPAPTVQYRRGEERGEATGNEVTIEVRSLLPKGETTADIHDIKPLALPPFDPRPLYLGALSLAALLAIAVGLWFVLNRPRQPYVVPPPPPDEVAFRALDRLRAQRAGHDDWWQPYYVELSAIVRAYIEARFGIHAPEMTTEEFLAAAGNDTRLTPTHRNLLAEFLQQADLVKFARALPSLDDAEAAYRSARRFVEETRLVAGAGLGGSHAA